MFWNLCCLTRDGSAPFKPKVRQAVEIVLSGSNQNVSLKPLVFSLQAADAALLPFCADAAVLAYTVVVSR